MEPPISEFTNSMARTRHAIHNRGHNVIIPTHHEEDYKIKKI